MFFLLDDRYYRSPEPLAGRPRQDDVRRAPARVAEAGARLRAARRASRSSPAAASSGSAPSRFEGWHQFRAPSSSAFADWLLAQKIDGVIFLSGDRHFGELLRIERPDAYPLYEFTSTPLTSRPPARLDAAERDNPDVVPGTLVGKRQFGLIRVSGPGDDRRIVARELRQRRRAAVAPRGARAATCASRAARVRRP